MILDSYIRWRHSHGFGVHSPFAYNIVTSAISPGHRYAYYGYEAIEETLENDSSTPAPQNRRRQDARLLLRLIVALGYDKVLLPPETDAALIAAVRASGAKEDSRYPDLAVTYTPEQAVPLLEAGIPVLIMSPERRCDMNPAIPGETFNGLILLGLRKALIIPRKQMARTFYTMAF